jgi:WD40 repeat protein
VEILEKIKYHITLASYFAGKSLYLDEPDQKNPNTRKLVEQPWQQTKAKKWDEVSGILCNLDFIQAFALAKIMYDLLSDYTMVLDELPENQENISKEKQNLTNLNIYFAQYLKFLNKDISKLNTIESVSFNFQKLNLENSSPERMDLLKTFYRFVSNEIRLMIHYCSINSFIRQLAFNQNDRLINIVAKPFRDDSIKNGSLFFQIDKIFNNEISVLTEHKFSIIGKNHADFGIIISSFFIDFTFNHIYIASDNVLQKWNVKNCFFEEEFLFCENTITSFCLTPDLKYGIILTSSIDQKTILIVYDFETSKPVSRFPINEMAPYVIGISADGRYGFTEFYDRIVIWDIRNYEVKNEIRLKNKAGRSQRFFFINNFEYLLFDESKISVRNIETDQLVFCFNEPLISDSALIIRFTPDIRYVFIGTRYSIYKVDLEKKKKSVTMHIPLSYSDFKVTADGNYVYLTHENQICILKTIHSESPICVYIHNEEISDFELSVDGKNGAILGIGEDYVSLINFEIRETLKDLIALPFDAAFSKNVSNNEYILYAADKYLTVVGNNRIIKKFEFPLYIADENFAYDISADGSHLAYAPSACNAIIKDFSKNSIYQTATPNESQITSLNISPDCRLIASADYGDSVIISFLKNGEHIKTIGDFQTPKAMTVRFSPSSRYLAISAGNKIHIWDTCNFKLFKTINAHRSWITSLFFSPDETTLISASEDQEIVAWDFESFNCINILKTKGKNLKLSSIFQNKKIIVGNSVYKDDNSIIIETHNFLKYPLTTIMRTWKFASNSEGYWDKSYSYACDHCESKIYDNDQIEKILSERYFKKKPDSENAIRKKLNIIKCGKCGNFLILNDFIVN